MDNPLLIFWQQQGAFFLDGGLATELEARGYDLDDPLWSARLLVEAPAAIQAVHEAYLHAGADGIISASYQATIPGFQARGLSENEAVFLLRWSATLATAARDRFWAAPAARRGRLRPLVAASIGPYGAYLADGSEYTGRYGLSVDALVHFHQRRWQILAGSGVDLLACETIPDWQETQALARLAQSETAVPVWFSFSCADGAHLHDGTPLAQCAALLDSLPAVAAIGVNCTAPRHISALIAVLRATTTKPIVVYPNSGERYDAANGGWHGEADPSSFGSEGQQWFAAGARLLGGCCRTGPDHIRQLRAAVLADNQGIH